MGQRRHEEAGRITSRADHNREQERARQEKLNVHLRMGRLRLEVLDAKAQLTTHTAVQLRKSCDLVGFSCGVGATKEAMVRGLVLEHGWRLESLRKESGGVLGALAAETPTRFS